MNLDRRTFQQLLVMTTAASFLTRERQAFALGDEAWRELGQPFAAQVQRLLLALDLIGEPLPRTVTESLRKALTEPAGGSTVERLDTLLRPYVLIDVTINPESRVSAMRGAVKAELVEQGWRSFLVRVTNQAKDTSVLQIRSLQARAMGRPSGNETVSPHDFTIGAVDAVEAESRWIALSAWDKAPLQPALSGLELEYRILQIYSRDHGRREATLEAVTSAGTQDLGYRSSVAILFDCVASQAVRLRIRDQDDRAATASLLITDTLGRIYPAQSKRALPDLWFQPQVYRNDGEDVLLAPGRYVVSYGRGPEFLRKTMEWEVRPAKPTTMELALERWVSPAHFGYYSGDSHIHAAGCSHYESPSEGVTPEVMLRQVQGEALDVGAVLTWAPGFLYQSRFFSGHVHQAASMPMLPAMKHAAHEPALRYDLEVSGFPSSHCGHLVLLKLKQQNYPGTTMPDDWPSWNLPILQWAKAQGAITGYAHSGWGMSVDSLELPNDMIPHFDSCGANEYLVDVTHEGMLDFISGCDLWPFVELNLWYHVLNCGFFLRFAGETDFPCITDKAVGGGRSYVRLDAAPEGDEGYEAWLVHGLQRGDSYFGDGRSHLFDFMVQAPNSKGEGRALHLAHASEVQVSARVCAWLEPEMTETTEQIRLASPFKQPYWHLERARIGRSRKVLVEAVVNGKAIAHCEVEADGSVQSVKFRLMVEKSSWIALRVLPSSHTNPVFVEVSGDPVRASRSSAAWCRKGIDVCWEQKAPRIRASELGLARAAYDHARAAYDRIHRECLN